MKSRAIIPILFFASAIVNNGCKNKTLQLYPIISTSFKFSIEEETFWQQIIDKSQQIENGSCMLSELTAAEQAGIDSMNNGYGPFTQGSDCSWYCGGQMYKVTSTAIARNNQDSNYLDQKAHDFNLFSTWISQNTSSTSWDKISFHFRPKSPRVTEIIIYNGVLKNDRLFKEYSRAKVIDLYIDKVYYATLHLADSSAQQTFSIAPIQSKDSITDLELTFEIVEIFEGNTSNAAAISEINFNGIDVH
ncbi:MAG: hypothetical protein RL660_1009 [Bacteroidota bacterium]|jgi:hypothetical protein